mgnify:FL=1|jgi:polar amino acid transport system substrate-binding protein
MKFLLKNYRIQFLFLFLIIIASFAGGCFGTTDEKGTVIETAQSVEKSPDEYHTTFRILTEEFPPYNYTEAGKIDGISTEIVREILKNINHPDNLEVLPWAQGYDLLQKEDNIILFSTTRSPIREDLFKWVGPLVPNNTTFFAKKGSGISISSLDDGKKVKSIGVYKNDFGELLLKKRGFENLDPEIDNYLNVKKLVEGKIDLWIINELTGRHMAMVAGLADKIEKVYEVQKDYMYMAFSKNTPDIVIKEWQYVLELLKDDGIISQIYSKRILSSYSDVSQLSKKLSADEKGTVIEAAQSVEKSPDEYHTTFRILTEEFPPYNYTEAGKIDGISTEIVREILKNINHPDNLEVLPWAQGYDLLQKEDNIILFSTTRSPIREDLFKWVGPLVPNNTTFFAKKGSGISISSLDDGKKVKSIGVYKNDFGELLLKKRGFENLDPEIDNYLNVKKLVEGKIDLWIINELTGRHMAMVAGLADKIEKVYEVQKDYMYMAFSKNTPDIVIKEWQYVLELLKADGIISQIYSKRILSSY